MSKRQHAANTNSSLPHGVRKTAGAARRLIRRPRRWTAQILPDGIRQRLFLLIVLAAVPVLILQGTIYYQRDYARRQQTMQMETDVAQGVAMTFSAYLDGVHRQLDTIGQTIQTFSPYTDAKVRRVLKMAVTEHPSMRSMEWVSPEGKILISNLAEGGGQDLSFRPYFQEIQGGQSWALSSLTEHGAITGNATVAMGVGVRDDKGKLLGVVVARLEPTRLGELTFPEAEHEGGVYTIFDREGRLVYRDPPTPLTWEQRTSWGRDDPLLQQALKGQAVEGTIASAESEDHDIAARLPIPGTGWVAGASRPVDIAMAPVRRALFADAMFGVMVASIALALAALAAHTIAGPLRRLEHDAEAMGNGAIPMPLDLEAPIEVRSLRSTVAAMASDLIERAAALRESEERYRTLFTNMSEGFALGEAMFQDDDACDFRFLEINEGFTRQTGLTREILGRPMTKVLPHLESHWVDTYCGVARTGEPVRFVDYNKDTGRYYDVFCYRPIPGRFAILFRDVTERVEAEQNLREANERLQEQAEALQSQSEELQAQTEELQTQTEELRSAYDTLERREREYRTLAENTPEMISRFDRRLRHTYINAYGAQVYGMSPKNVIGKTSDELGMPVDIVAFWKKRFEQVLATGRQQTVDFEFDSPTFGPLYFSSLFVPEFNGDGDVTSILAITRDVTAVKRAEDSLRRSEERYRRLFEDDLTGNFVAEPDGRILLCNAAFARIYGFDDPEEAVGTNLVDLKVHPENWGVLLDRVKEHRIVERFESSHRRRDGTTISIIENIGGQFDTDGTLTQVQGYVIDITERKQAEEALRESEARHRRLLENLKGSHFIYVHDTNGVFQYLSESITAILGYTPEEFMTHYDKYLTDHPVNEAVHRHTELSIQGIRQPLYEVNLWHKDGSTRWLEVQEAPVFDSEGKVVAVEGVAQDITERKRAEEALRESEQWFRTLANTMPQLVWTADPDGRVNYYNERHKEYRGIEQTADGSFQWTPVLHKDDVEATVKAWEHAIRTGETYQIEHRVQRADGTYHWHLSRGMPVRDREGRIVKWFGTATDIDTVKRAEEALREMTVMLESKVAQRTAQLEHRARQLQKLTLELSQTEDRERRRLADILHDDLQQQLAAVKFHLGLMKTRTRSDATVQDMTTQIDGMLRTAIETSRSLSHELSPAMLYQGNLAETFEWLADQIRMKHGLDIHVHADGLVKLESDALKAFLYKAAQEMLFNVVKHARVGEAALRLRRVGRHVCLLVSDRGRGFDPQVLKATTGFGLFGIRERVELLGGRMKIRSAEGKGSTFFLAVPDSQVPDGAGPRLENRSDSSAVVDPPPSGPTLRVLLADDHEVVRQGLASLLGEEPDIEVVGEAANGREAVDLASRLRPDVVIMDVAMPLMNGDEATRQTKLHLPETRVIALSMYAEDSMVDRMRRAGAESYLLKTAPAEELLAMIRGKKVSA